MNIIYRILEQKGLQIEQFLNDPQFIELRVHSPHSITETIDCISSLTTKIDRLVKCQAKPQMIVNIVRDYIRSHLDNELTREQIAGCVYLNPDYLDRLFKKETGMSVSKYVMQERLKVACELLEKTDVSISEIAVSVGYINLSNFSGMFKKIMDCTPMEYRKQSSIKKG